MIRLPIVRTGLLLVLVMLAVPASAQYLFGKNKINYSRHEWQIITSDLVELFYYPEEEHLAVQALQYADSVCLELQQVFAVETTKPVPLILYSSQHGFRETNVIPNIISESVGGFTDLIRGRVVVPSTGSQYQLLHVIRHELVHAYMLEKLSKVMGEHRQYSYRYPPLWFVEGLAEFYSVGSPDTEGDMLLRAGMIEGSLPHLTNMWSVYGTYLMYKMGQSVVAYLDRNYSTAAVREILEEWHRGSDFNRILERNLGLTLEELDRSWRNWLRRRYFPEVSTRSPAEEVGCELVKDERGYQTRPVALGDSTFAYLETTTGLINVRQAHRLRHPRAKSKSKLLLRGGRSADIESIPMFRSGMSHVGASELGESVLLMTVRSGPGDHLVWFDVRSREILCDFKCDSVIQMETPTVNSRGQILFSGLDPTGRRDLFLLEGDWRAAEPGWRLTRLTDDDYDDRDPSWRASGERFIFSSDCGFETASPYRNLFEMELASGDLTRLTHGEWVDKEPACHPQNDSYLYASDQRGAWDIFLADGAEHGCQTSVYGAVLNPAWADDGFMASVYHRGVYRIFHFDLKSDTETITRPSAYFAEHIAAVDTATAPGIASAPYNRRWGLDFINTGLAYDPEFGNMGGGQVGFTDLLGNHQLMLTVANDAQSTADILKRLNVGVGYLNMERRWNWNVALFHLSSDYDSNWDQYRFERRMGGLIGVRYPLNLFRRVEFSFNVRAIMQEDDIVYSFRDPDAVLASFYTSWIHDTVLWGWGGPWEGERINITYGYTEGFKQRGMGYSVFKIDARKYWRLPSGIVYASRLMGHYSEGKDPRFFHLGGPIQLRGWPTRYFHSRGVWLSNQELRFPVFNRMSFILPFGAVELPPVRGSLFVDTARLMSRYYAIAQPQWAGSLGGGLELSLGPVIVFRWNMVRKTDFKALESDTIHQVFLGWNF
ncbi:MAG: hypothetical protein GY835_20220 [bacterium]|nr:hypothetical protein [bacterium]